MADTKDDDFWSDNDDTPIIKPRDVFTVNEVRSCRELYDMIKEGTLETKPKYQRNVVWGKDKQTRFIDSLFKQLPIPSLCISNSDEHYQAIDGQQRLTTIEKFFTDTEEWVLDKLDDIDPELSGKSNIELLRNMGIASKIKNFMLPVTIIMCDYTKEDHLEYIFKIFHRLNSTAEVLKNQEIRNCIYSGVLNDLVNELGNLENFTNIRKLSKNTLDRLGGSESVLIFFAFYDNLSSYQGRLTSFLNKYMSNNKDQSSGWIESKRSLFLDTIKIVEKIKNLKTSNAIFNPVMYGIAKNLQHLRFVSDERLQEIYDKLENSSEFSVEELKGGTWSKHKVEQRFLLAEEIFRKG